MKHINRRQKGLTLLELILALTILSVVVLASSNLNLSAIRLTDLVARDTQVQNELQYVLRDLKLHLMGSHDPITDCSSVNFDCSFQIIDANNELVSYTYTASNARRLVRSAEGKVVVLSEGMLIPNPKTVLDGAGVPKPLPVFEIVPGSGDKLVRVSFSAERTVSGNTIALEGVSESILLRGEVG